MINPKAIEVFLALVEHRSLSRVAKVTHFSQPTVSEYLNQLEDAVGTTLFLRGKGQRQIVLTPTGEAFLPLAKKWMENQLELEKQIRQFSQTRSTNILRLAASSGAHQTVASDVICKLMACRPNLQLQLSNVERREMLTAIKNYAFDMAFMFGAVPESDLVTTVQIFEEPQYILCQKENGGAKRFFTPADLNPSQEIAYISYIRSEAFRQWHRNCFPETEEQPIFTASSLGAVHNYLTAAESWSVVPASVALTNAAQNPELICRPIEPAPPPRQCSLLISKAYREEKVVRDVLRCCEELIEQRKYLRKCTGQYKKVL